MFVCALSRAMCYFFNLKMDRMRLAVALRQYPEREVVVCVPHSDFRNAAYTVVFGRLIKGANLKEVKNDSEVVRSIFSATTLRCGQR